MSPVLAGIPYRTFPDFSVGPLTVRTFGLMVGIGVLLGAWIAARDIERWGVPREETYRLATRMVVAGLIGSRVTWVLSHLGEIDSPIDVIAIWEGGIQFSGGFIAAIVFGFPTFRKWSPKLRWRSLDGYAYGLTIGLAIGRIGCYSVGEHFGRTTEFFLGTTFRGGSTQEDFIGSMPLDVGMTFHNTALYEFLHLLVLFGLLTLLRAWARRAGRVLEPGHDHRHLLHLVRDRPVRHRHDPGQRRAGPAPHRRPGHGPGAGARRAVDPAADPSTASPPSPRTPPRSRPSRPRCSPGPAGQAQARPATTARCRADRGRRRHPHRRLNRRPRPAAGDRLSRRRP